MNRIISMIVCLSMLGCAVTPQVAIDPKSITDKAKYKEDMAECRTVSESYNLTDSALKNAAVGGAAGGVAMAGVTAAVAGVFFVPFILAASAAGAGLGGGTTKMKEVNAREKILAQCMNERGYKAYTSN